MDNKFIINLDKIIAYLVKGLIFLLPLFFLPGTFEFFEFNKQGILWLIVPLIVILWLVKAVKFEKKIIFRRTPLDISILTFLVATFLASIFSQDRFSSFFGYYGRFSDAWLGLLAFVIFYFVIVNTVTVSGRVSVISLVKLLVYSYSLILLTAFFSVFGLWDKLLKGTNIFYSSAFNLLGGSLEVMAIYSLIMIILLTGLIGFYYRGEKAGSKKNIWLLKIILFFSLVFLVLVNFYLVWRGLLVSSLLFFLVEFKLANFKINNLNKKVSLFILLLVVFAAGFLIFPSRLEGAAYYLTGQKLPEEIRLDYKSTALVMFASLKNNLMLGSGPGTFSYDFSLYRPLEFNQNKFWQFRFDKGASHILEIIGTTGILGALSYFLILILFFYLLYIFIKKVYLSSGSAAIFPPAEEDKESGRKNSLTFTIIIALLALIFFQFFYLTNTAALFLFWVLLALLMVLWRECPGWLVFKSLKLDKSKSFFKVFDLIIFFFFSAWLILAGFTARYWLADLAARAGDETSLIKATQLNSHRADYQIRLARSYLNKIRAEAFKPADFRNDKAVQEAIDDSIAWAKAAVKTRPNSVAALETLGMVYRDIRFFTQGSEIWAAKAFSQAAKLEPSNPVIITELGKAYLEADKTEEAEQSFKQALELKDDYHEADFGLARLYGQQGKTEEALEILDRLSKIYKDERIYYEQGRLYYNQGETDKALEKFLKVIEINPEHANALYSIGLALELKGEDKLALKYFKMVLELNPNSLEVKRKVEAMEK